MVYPSMKIIQKIDITEMNEDTPGDARGIGWSPPAGNYQSPLPGLCLLSSRNESKGLPGLRAAKYFINFAYPQRTCDKIISLSSADDISL